jgi:hypothetical protein
MTLTRRQQLLLLYLLVTAAAALLPYAVPTDNLDSPTPLAAAITWLLWALVLWRGYRGSLRSLDILIVLSGVSAGITLVGFFVVHPHDVLFLAMSLGLAAGGILLRSVGEEIRDETAADDGSRALDSQTRS